MLSAEKGEATLKDRGRVLPPQFRNESESSLCSRTVTSVVSLKKLNLALSCVYQKYIRHTGEFVMIYSFFKQIATNKGFFLFY